MGYESLKKAMERSPVLIAGPPCPACKSVMVERKVHKPGPRYGQPFWGCSDFPVCKATMPHAVGVEVLRNERKIAEVNLSTAKAVMLDKENTDDLGFLALLDD